MTKTLPSFFFALCVVLVSFNMVEGQTGADAQIQFDEAGNLLTEGKLEEAVTIYRQMEANNFASGPLFLNMGIIAVQQDSLGLAKYYFLKASKYDATAKDALEGIDYAESRFSRQSAILPKLPWERAFEWMNKNIGVSVFFIVGSLILNTAVVFIIIFWLQAEKRVLLKSSFYMIPLGVTMIILAFYLDYQDSRYAEAIMIDEQTNVVASPDNTGDLISLAYEGYSFTVDQTRSNEIEGWSYVRMSNGLYGWIESHNIKII